MESEMPPINQVFRTVHFGIAPTQSRGFWRRLMVRAALTRIRGLVLLACAIESF
jgi:hypothetical protein